MDDHANGTAPAHTDGAEQPLFVEPLAPAKSRNLKTKLKRLFSKKAAPAKAPEALPVMEEKIQPAMANLTDELIEETAGENGILVREFRKQLNCYDPDRNPIGPNEARAIMLSMLDLAASRRKLLNERLEQSAEIGDLYKRYYKRVDEVTNLAIRAATDLERMDLAEEDYRYHYAMLLNVRDTSVINAIQPQNEHLKKLMELRTRMINRSNDVMLELKKRGEE